MGGAEHSIKLLAENLAKNGHETAVFCIDSKESDMTKTRQNQVTIYRTTGGIYPLYQAYSKGKGLLKTLYYKSLELWNPSIAPDFQKAINDFKPEIVHTNCLPGISLAVWQMLSKENIPIVHTLRDYWMISPRGIIEDFDHVSKPYYLYCCLFSRYAKKRAALLLQ